MQWFQERQIISALIWNLVHICHDGAGGGFKQQECSVVKWFVLAFGLFF